MKNLRILRAKLDFVKNKWMELDNSKVKQNPDDHDEIWNMYEETYKNIGSHLTRDKLFSKYDGWLILDHDEDPYADVFRTFTDTPYGKKMGVSGTDGSPESKEAQKNAIGKYLNTKGYFSELSGKTEYVAQNRGVPFIDNQELVEQILEGKKVIWEGDGYYTRMLGEMGKVTKRLYGHPIGVDQALLQASFKYKGEVRGH
jgi:hypothetical protein